MKVVASIVMVGILSLWFYDSRIPSCDSEDAQHLVIELARPYFGSVYNIYPEVHAQLQGNEATHDEFLNAMWSVYWSKVKDHNVRLELTITKDVNFIFQNSSCSTSIVDNSGSRIHADYSLEISSDNHLIATLHKLY